MEMQTLRVLHYGETPEEDRRVTISPGNVVAMTAEIDDVQVQGRSLRNVSILIMDGGSLPLCIDHSDLALLESTIGAYCFE